MPINTTGTSVIMAKLISMISMGYLLYGEANIIPYVFLRKTQDAGTFSLYWTARGEAPLEPWWCRWLLGRWLRRRYKFHSKIKWILIPKALPLLCVCSGSGNGSRNGRQGHRGGSHVRLWCWSQ